MQQFMNTPPEGSLTPRPRPRVIISRGLMDTIEAPSRMVPLHVVWPATAACLMPVLIMHCVIPGMPVAGAN